MTPDEKAELRKAAETLVSAEDGKDEQIRYGAFCKFVATARGATVLALLDENAQLAEQVKALDCGCGWQNRTGGGHSGDCYLFEPECTCYEVIGGHQPGCYFHGLARHKRTVAELENENARLAAEVEGLRGPASLYMAQCAVVTAAMNEYEGYVERDAAGEIIPHGTRLKEACQHLLRIRPNLAAAAK